MLKVNEEIILYSALAKFAGNANSNTDTGLFPYKVTSTPCVYATNNNNGIAIVKQSNNQLKLKGIKTGAVTLNFACSDDGGCAEKYSLKVNVTSVTNSEAKLIVTDKDVKTTSNIINQYKDFYLREGETIDLYSVWAKNVGKSADVNKYEVLRNTWSEGFIYTNEQVATVKSEGKGQLHVVGLKEGKNNVTIYSTEDGGYEGKYEFEINVLPASKPELLVTKKYFNRTKQ